MNHIEAVFVYQMEKVKKCQILKVKFRQIFWNLMRIFRLYNLLGVGMKINCYIVRCFSPFLPFFSSEKWNILKNVAPPAVSACLVPCHTLLAEYKYCNRPSIFTQNTQHLRGNNNLKQHMVFYLPGA